MYKIKQFLLTNKNTNEYQKILNFYNENFLESLHSFKYKEKMYYSKKRDCKIYIIKENQKIIALLESWNSREKKDEIILASILVSIDYRGIGLGQKLFTKFLNEIKEENKYKKLIVHFRESKKEKLIPFYKNLGFKIIKNSSKEKYSNGENKLSAYMKIN